MQSNCSLFTLEPGAEKVICAQKYAKGLLEYELLSDGKGFQHNLDRDLHLLIIWQNGRAVEEQILAETLRRFDVLATIEIQWSPEHIDNNFKRFYKHIPTDRVQGKAAQVGAGAFICVLFEDLHPLYQYRQTVSGSIELANVNVLDLKRDSRERCGGYFVHSSGSPDEFFEQAALLFEANQLRDILEGQWRGDRKTLARDLSGSQGWHDFAELFSVLRYCSPYVVLRNFEFLPDAFFENDKDVDILCANSIDLRLAANATVRDQVEGCVKLNIKVAGVDVPFDVRRVGDDYYDANWQRAILKHRTCGAGGIFRPRDDDYFFSLYYQNIPIRMLMQCRHVIQRPNIWMLTHKLASIPVPRTKLLAFVCIVPSNNQNRITGFIRINPLARWNADRITGKCRTRQYRRRDRH